MSTPKDIVEEAIGKWQKVNPPEKITEHVFKMLNTGRDEIIGKMSGFDNRWGKWELDHCNGRTQAVSTYVIQIAQGAINQWVKANIPDNLPEMDEGMVEAVLEEYKKNYTELLSAALWKAAQEKAEEDARKYMEQFAEENPIFGIKLFEEAKEPGWK